MNAAPAVDANAAAAVFARVAVVPGAVTAGMTVGGRSVLAIVPHAGFAETVPFPVWVRNILVAEVFPASRAATGVEFWNSMSPRVVIGDRFPKASVAVVPPVPPPAMGVNCHVAALPLVAMSDWFTTGAAAADTFTEPVRSARYPAVAVEPLVVTKLPL